MHLLLVVLLVLTVVLCGLAAFGVGHPRLHLGWLGVACAALALLIGNWPGV